MAHPRKGMTAWSKFGQIKDVLDKEDIEGLLVLGCPSDEYDGEASLIESGVARVTNFGKSKTSVDVVEAIICEVWNNQFGPFDPLDLEKRRPAFTSVAQKIAAALP
jgi:hypothetical protein